MRIRHQYANLSRILQFWTALWRKFYYITWQNSNNSHWEPPLPNALRLGWVMRRGEPYGGHFPRAQGKISTPSYHNKPKRKGLLLTTLDSPSTMTKKGEKSKMTSRKNWRKDERASNARLSIKRYLIRKEIATSLVTGRGLQIKNEGKTN